MSRFSFSLQLLAQRVRGRATCVKPPSARILSSAKIFNLSGDSARIAIGEHTIVRGELLVFAHGGHIEIGAWCYIGEGTRIWSGAHVQIGSRVMIAHGVDIFDNLTHPRDAAARHRHFRAIYLGGHPADIDLEDRPVTICDDAWIGAGACVGRGVRIGTASIVGARAVVVSDVPDYCVVAGNPARIVRHIKPSENSGAS